MGWAFEGVPWDEVPAEETFAIWRHQAVVRDSFLTDAELLVKLRTIDSMRLESLWVSMTS